MIKKRLDSNGHTPTWRSGEKCWVAPEKKYATVVEQILSFVEDDSSWGDVIVRYDNGIVDVKPNWQIVKIHM
jgi:hypothetical protein